MLREGDSINFQKASCTLDGCVKIYTSRVDSVDVETKKLLNGLQTYGKFYDEMRSRVLRLTFDCLILQEIMQMRLLTQKKVRRGK